MSGNRVFSLYLIELSFEMVHGGYKVMVMLMVGYIQQWCGGNDCDGGGDCGRSGNLFNNNQPRLVVDMIH